MSGADVRGPNDPKAHLPLPAGTDEAFEPLYRELCALARAKLRSQRPGESFSTTVLVHETYLRLADLPASSVVNRAHYFFLASKAMRWVIIDELRRRYAEARGGGWERIELTESAAVFDRDHLSLLDLDRALTRLAERDPRKAQIVELRFWGGLTVEEVAEVLELSPPTIYREWNFARAWLYRELELPGRDS